MAETKSTKIEREYIIPLRREIMKVPAYRATGRAIKAIKQFIAKHMKVEDRDVDKVKLDMHFNNEIWYRGRAAPPMKIKVKATKEDGIVHVTFAETPGHIKFIKAKINKVHKKSDEKPSTIVPTKSDTKETKTEEEKKDESEKGKSVAEQNMKVAEQEQKTQKHLSKVKEESYHRMALKK